jgi:transcriptional regulator with XRE-family HTH domain
MSEKKPPINVDYFEDLTGEIAACQETCREQLGDRIRRLRQDKGLSIEQLSHLTGFDEQTLQDIETNVLSPQLGTIIKLGKALNTALRRLVSDEGEKLYVITRKDERNVVHRSVSAKGQRADYTYMSLAPDVKGRHMEALIVQLEQMVDEQYSVHGGEEFIYVLEGVVIMKIGEDHFELQPGDSAYYLSTTPHLLSAKAQTAKIIAVIYSE